MAVMKHVISSLLLVVVGSVVGAEPGVTGTIESRPAWDTGRRALVGGPKLVSGLIGPDLVPLPSDSGWSLIDSISRQVMIPAGERLAVVFDSAAECLRDTLLPVFLTETARLAVAVAPDWLKDDLADKFRRLSASTQNAFGDMIVNCPDKRYYDELCFQVAHLAPTVFIYLPPQLLVDNVADAYASDPQLDYVDIVDHGDPVRGGDYWSTTRYRAIVAGETTLVDIPRDVYYWWVIMPKITDETVKYVSGWFWRGFLFNQCDSGYPLLKEKLAGTTVLWNGERQNWPNRGLGYPDTLPAVAVVSRWVAHTLPEAARPPRPIQPVEIAKDHNGNCGEVQDLLCAAARTALIPCGGVMDINEDHVWCEIWWQGGFRPWQVDLGGGVTNINSPHIAYDRRHGGSKECSGIWDWRNDGWQRSVVETYSDCCTLTVAVYDADARPVDCAIIKILSEGWHTPQLYNCFFGTTDRAGTYTTTLGDWQNFYLDVVSDLGRHSPGLVIDSADCAPGTHFFYACTLSGRRDSLTVRSDSASGQDVYRVDVTWTVPRTTVYGYDCWSSGGANEYALPCSTGGVDFFMCDRAGFTDYLAGAEFGTFVHEEDAATGACSLVLGRTGDYCAVWSNEEQENLTVLADVTVRLYKHGVGVAEPRAGPGPEQWVRWGANPCQGRFEVMLRAGRPADAVVCVLDRAGRLVRRLVPYRTGACTVVWDGRDGCDRVQPAGVYFCRVSGLGRSLTRPIVYLGD